MIAWGHGFVASMAAADRARCRGAYRVGDGIDGAVMALVAFLAGPCYKFTSCWPTSCGST